MIKLAKQNKNENEFIIAKIGARFVVTIPREIKETLKWKEGDTIALWTKDSEVLMIAKLRLEDQLKDLKQKYAKHE